MGIERERLNIENLSITLLQKNLNLQAVNLTALIVATAAQTVTITLVDQPVAIVVLQVALIEAIDITLIRMNVLVGAVHTIVTQTAALLILQIGITIATTPTVVAVIAETIAAAQGQVVEITIVKAIPAVLINVGQTAAKIIIQITIPFPTERVKESSEEQIEEIIQLLDANSTEMQGFFKIKKPFFYLHTTIKLPNCLI